MILRLGRRVFEASRLLVMAVVAPGPGEPAAAMERVHAVVAEGADIVEVTGEREVAPFVAVVRDAYPELVIGVRTGRAEVAREACAAGADLMSGSGRWAGEAAAASGAGVAGPLDVAERAVAAGVTPERIIVVSSARELAGVVAAGWPVLVSLTGQDPAASLATAAVGAWLGARVFRVDQVGQTRRALRMVSAIRGDIPPGYAVRGLA